MTRCIALSVRSAEEGEYPYGAVIRRADQVVGESINRMAREHDVTRHAEVVAISRAQKSLCTTSLDDLHHLRECGTMCLLFLCYSREPNQARALWSSFAAYGGRLEMECADRPGATRAGR
jgi:tRNA(Arg) A34 adenosine deaminase TadA